MVVRIKKISITKHTRNSNTGETCEKIPSPRSVQVLSEERILSRESSFPAAGVGRREMTSRCCADFFCLHFAPKSQCMQKYTLIPFSFASTSTTVCNGF